MRTIMLRAWCHIRVWRSSKHLDLPADDTPQSCREIGAQRRQKIIADQTGREG